MYERKGQRIVIVIRFCEVEPPKYINTLNSIYSIQLWPGCQKDNIIVSYRCLFAASGNKNISQSELSYLKILKIHIFSEWNFIWKEMTIDSNCDKDWWNRATISLKYLHLDVNYAVLKSPTKRLFKRVCPSKDLSVMRFLSQVI